MQKVFADEKDAWLAGAEAFWWWPLGLLLLLLPLLLPL